MRLSRPSFMAGRRPAMINWRKNTWMLRIFLCRDGDGKRQYETIAMHGVQKVAKASHTATLSKKDLGIPTFESKVTLGKYLDEWLESVAKPRVSERTHVSYEALLTHVKNALASTRLSKLRAEDIQKLYGTLSSSTARHVHAPLRSALKQAVKWQLIYANPCDAVELPHHRAREMEWLTKDEAGRLLKKEGKH